MSVKLQCLRCLIASSSIFMSLTTQSADIGQEASPSPSPSEEVRKTQAFSRDWLEEHAKNLSLAPYKAQSIDEDNPLSKLTYDQYQAIEFKRGAAIWEGQDRGFFIGLLHPGFLFKTPVSINLVVDGISRRVLYEPKVFNYGNDSDVVKGLKARGYSGFRVNTQINKENVWDEFLVFQGGSYFRALGKTSWYGLSARGLAIDTAQPTGEEFPEFTEFWIERPSPNSNSLIIHALLESPSLTGAFTFHAKPGELTKVEVQAKLFARKKIDSFGIAPLTSMFLFDGTNTSRFDDFRPAVHDSNGLLIKSSNGERVWRPLANPKKLQLSSFNSKQIEGFGLMQRSRDFKDFEDGEAKYERRPSVWIEPGEGWPKGHVELIEIPSDQESNDNIVAFWKPHQALSPSEPLALRYTLSWGEFSRENTQAGRVISTRSGRALNVEGVREFVVDFQADDIPEDTKVHVESSNGKIIDARGFILDAKNSYRAIFKFEPSEEELTEFRLSLSSQDESWGETWLYRWTR